MPFTPLKKESRFTPTSRFTPIEDESSVLEIIGKQVPSGMLDPLRGLVSAEKIKQRTEKEVSESVGRLLPKPAGQNKKERAEAIAAITGKPYEPPVETKQREEAPWLKHLEREVSNAEKFYEVKIKPESSFKRRLAQASSSIGSMAVTLPFGGAKAQGVVSGLRKAQEVSEKEAPLSTVYGVGAIQGLSTWLTELDPTETLLKRGKPFINRLARGLVTDTVGEEIDQLGTEMWLIDEKIMGGKHSKEEYKQAFWDTLVVSGMVTGAATVLTQPGINKQEKLEKAIEERDVKTRELTDILEKRFTPIEEGDRPKTIGKEEDFTELPTEEELRFQELSKRQEELRQEAPTKERGKFTPIEEDTTGSQEFEEKSGLYTVSTEKPLIEMPELVELARSINEGKSPLVKEKLRNALGKLTAKPGALGEADISLRADIFAGDLISQRNVKSKEADAEMVFFKQEVIEAAEESGLDTEKLIFKKERNKRGGVDLKAYQKNPQLAPNVMSHEIGHLIDYLPDKDIRRGNVLGRIKVLKKHLAHTIDSLPTDPSKALTAKDRGKLRRDAARFVGKRPEDTGSAEYKAWKNNVTAQYQALVKGEIAARGLITRDEVMTELKAVSQTRKPFNDAGDPNYTKYRYSSPELYADAISAYITTPKMFKTKAPKFGKAFLAYLDKKPNVKSKLGELVERGLGTREAIVDTRIDKLYNMMGEGNKARQELNQRQLADEEGLRDTLTRGLVDKYHSSLKHIRTQEKRGGELGAKARKARFDLEETSYIASEAENYFFNINKGIIEAAESQGATTEDIGLYMFANRVAKERGDIANPLGHTQESATEILNTLPKRWGAQRFNAVERAATDFYKMRNDLILSHIEDSGLFTPELIETIKNNPDYAKFSVHKFLKDKFGGGVASKVYHQIGTLSEVENPFIATVMQDISLIRAAAINNSKTSLVEVMKEVPDILSPADMKWSSDKKTRVPVEPKNPKLGIITLMEDGKPKHFYVSKAISDTYKYAPVEATWAARAWSSLNAPIRAILVNKNPLWMARNVVRDLKATIKNNPEIKLRNVFQLLSDYKKAFGESWKDVVGGDKSADIQELLKGKALLSDRAYASREKTFDDELERLANQFSIVAETEATGARVKLKKAWDFLDKIGKVSERTGKVAGFKYLKNRTDLSAKEIAHRVRTRIGTPDVKRQGAWQALTNNIFMFSNVNKEGIRSSYESYKEDKGAYIWKTIAMNILPKAALAGMAYVALKSDDDEFRRLYSNIPESDMKNYTTMPLFLTEDGKTIYLRLPEDYQGQLFGSLAWDAAQGKFTGKHGAISTLGEASPYQLNPVLDLGLDMVNYYVFGNNPQDEFRGRPVIPDLAYQVGGIEAHKAMAKHAWTSLGGNAIYRPQYNIARDKSSIDKILSTPPFNVLGQFIRVSDRGTSEKYYKTLKESREGAAKASLARQRTIINGVNSGLDNDAILNELEKLDLLTPTAITQTRKYRALKVDNPEVNAYAQARTSKERQLLEKEFRKTMSKEEVDKIIDIWAEWKSSDQSK